MGWDGMRCDDGGGCGGEVMIALAGKVVERGRRGGKSVICRKRGLLVVQCLFVLFSFLDGSHREGWSIRCGGRWAGAGGRMASVACYCYNFGRRAGRFLGKRETGRQAYHISVISAAFFRIWNPFVYSF
jgi:hypothetical protein